MSDEIELLFTRLRDGLAGIADSLRLIDDAASLINGRFPNGRADGDAVGTTLADELWEDLARTHVPRAFLAGYSLFEFFLLSAYREALVAKPSLIGNRTVRGETFAVVADLPELLRTVAEGRARELAYQPLDELLSAIRKIFGVAVEPGERLRLLEIRETRNALTHNAGVAGRDYARLPDAVRRAEEGQSLLLDEVYRAESSALLPGIAGRVRDAA